jgi:hypothetical protein
VCQKVHILFGLVVGIEGCEKSCLKRVSRFVLDFFVNICYNI